MYNEQLNMSMKVVSSSKKKNKLMRLLVNNQVKNTGTSERLKSSKN